jgi:ribosomal-protein-alanine N-acetyltransferase
MKEGMTLRPILSSDAESITVILQNKEIHDNLCRLPWPYRLEHAIWFIRQCNEGISSGSKLSQAIEWNEEFVGLITINEIVNGAGEMGYWLSESVWGMGIISVAIPKMLERAVCHGMKGVWAQVLLNNEASSKALERSGFLYDPTKESEIEKDDCVIPTRYYSISLIPSRR